MKSENWYAAVVLALTLPDVCVRLEGLAGGANYKGWCATYVIPKLNPSTHEFVSAKDLWGIRCAAVHEGVSRTAGHQSTHVGEVVFVSPNNPAAMNRVSGPRRRILLQVDTFCNTICEGVDLWLADSLPNPTVQAHLPELLTVHEDEQGMFVAFGLVP